MRERIVSARTIEEARKAAGDGMAVISWCGREACADSIEKEIDASILGTDVRSPWVPTEEGPCLACGMAGRPAIIARSY